MTKTRGNSENEVAKAIDLYQRFGTALTQDPVLQDLFGRYRESIRETERMMVDSGVVAACSECAATRGSCCFEGMEDGYGAVLLLVNLWMGCDISAAPRYPASCRFVGKEGCILKARHSFCLNYFCPGLQDSLDDTRIDGIREGIGKQLLLGWGLESGIVRWIKDAKRRA